MAVWHTFFKFKAHQTAITLQRAVTPNPASSNSKKVRQTAITISRGLSHLTGWATLPSENISRHFFKGGETLFGHKWPFIFYE